MLSFAHVTVAPDGYVTAIVALNKVIEAVYIFTASTVIVVLSLSPSFAQVTVHSPYSSMSSQTYLPLETVNVFVAPLGAVAVTVAPSSDVITNFASKPSLSGEFAHLLPFHLRTSFVCGFVIDVSSQADIVSTEPLEAVGNHLPLSSS